MIRPATVADLDQILTLERAAFTAPHWPWKAYEDMLTGEHGAIRRTLLVAVAPDTAEERERVQGFAGGTVLYEDAQLESISVAERARRKGLGRALCLAFMQWARLAGAEIMGLEVRASSEGAQRLYAGLGFQPVGRRPHYYSNPVEDGILMRCPLAPGRNGPHV